jgi:two-component system chemotaxis response regulator CheB
VEARQALVAGLPRNFDASLFVVLHIGTGPSYMPKILSAAGPLPARHPADGEPIRPGRIYVAPPDHHLVVGPGHIRLSRGPRENHTRPAIDPLFRSAAAAYGRRVVGVLLSGTLSDGTAGFSAIKEAGGITVVQDPDDARFAEMPRSALRYVGADHCAPVAAIPDLLVRLSEGPLPHADVPSDAMLRSRGASEKMRTEMGEYTMQKPVALTCPECGGAVKETTVDSLPYFTCHIGHRFAGDNMAAAQFRDLEQAMEVAFRTLNERADLCRRMAERMREAGRELAADHWNKARQQSEEKAQVVRQFLEQEWFRPEHENNGDGQPAVAK